MSWRKATPMFPVPETLGLDYDYNVQLTVLRYVALQQAINFF